MIRLETTKQHFDAIAIIYMYTEPRRALFSGVKPKRFIYAKTVRCILVHIHTTGGVNTGFLSQHTNHMTTHTKTMRMPTNNM